MIKQCKLCGKEFLIKAPNAKYCSDECRNKARKERVKQWNEDHREYEREQAKIRYARNSERIKEYNRQYYQKNKEKRKAYDRAYYLAHIQDKREYARNQKANKKIRACSEAHNNCLSCDTLDGECKFE